MTRMRKALVAVAIATGAIMAIGAPSLAQAAEACQPSDAWTETISEAYDETIPAVTHVVHHEAVYEDVKVVDIPAQPAVPEVPEVSHVVHHEPEYVHHDALIHTEYHFAKFTRERSGEKKRGEVQWGDWSDWTLWTPVTHTSWELNTDPIGSPQPHAEWKDGKTYYERQWQARYDGTNRTIEDKAAWDEKVKDAWDEKVIDQIYVPGTPAVEEVSHIEQRLVSEAYDETVIDEPERVVHHDAVTVDHPAVVCPEPEPPTTIGTPEVPDGDPTPTAEARVLAQTGSDMPMGAVTIGASVLILAGLGGVALRRRMKNGRGTPQ